MQRGSEAEEHLLRRLDQFLDPHQEADGFRAVDDAVIVAEGDVHHRADLDLVVYRDGIHRQRDGQ